MNQFSKTSLAIFIISLLLASTACDRQESSETPEKSLSTVEKSAAGQSNPVDEGSQVLVTVLEFNEVEEGLDPYLTRMLVSDRYIRIDDGDQSDGYVLYDRLKKEYSVSSMKPNRY